MASTQLEKDQEQVDMDLLIAIEATWATETTNLCPDWIGDPHEDNDEESAYGFNEPTHWEPGGEEEEE